ncbi:MAG: hypothetical protein K9J24_14370 [Bacteroidales bacterium]|nr:hypothetical protein [Bacteroidales bacterium]
MNTRNILIAAMALFLFGACQKSFDATGDLNQDDNASMEMITFTLTMEI